ncbi:Arylamine N-acetyltransferase protein [Sinomonas atrocyanea]|uniref:Arylamine N-acetyltransferase protein n=1 Tax=Sinomonas atrocyanea TaxID=37927 RepID=A0A126ZWP7_9MICC|nr:arylamine N-acetyltransferase [Sinomonas atrocyanea]AMM30961.1 Arylamine N-acetyltransferase protein [Sinomonas atrocyanea]GEB63201.1 arylamine N-acetyltransferase [Sinomonas atrocyanea]GGG65706.1 arylamine N-acetyltransferase [Sinomonas atrocyanea]
MTGGAGRTGRGDARFLSAYFRRIGYTGDAAPTLAAIAAVHAHHTRAIPFENLAPATGSAVDITDEGIETALVDRRRGGYCFQHAGLLSRALAAMGVDGVENHLCRVYWGRGPGAGAPARTHQATVVEAEGRRYLVDAGFGGFNPSGILPLGLAPEDSAVSTPLGTFRAVDVAVAGLPAGDTPGIDLVVQARLGEGWATLYGVDLGAHARADFEVANWYVSTSDIPPFTRSLMASIRTETERITLANLELAVRTYRPDGASTVQRSTLGSADELREAARELFRIEDATLDWDRAYRVAAQA